MKQRRPKRRKHFRPPSTSKKGMAPEDALLLLREAAAAEKKAAPHKEMLSWIEVLEALIAELPKQHRGIGDNLQPIGDDELHSIINLVFILKHQPVVPTAPDDVRVAGSRLKKIGERLGTYLDTFLLEASKSGGKELGKRLAQAPFWLAVWYALTHIVQSVAAWLP
jgi:hypothetical protein